MNHRSGNIVCFISDIFNPYFTIRISMKIKKIFTTPEVPMSFKKVLQTLSIFVSSEMIVTSENLGRNHTLENTLNAIQHHDPQLVVTGDRSIVQLINVRHPTIKIILLAACGEKCDRQFLSNALIIDSFLSSKRAKVFEID